MSTDDRPNEYRPVNPMLGQRPTIGPFPADQILPWALISTVLWIIGQFISLPMIWTVLLILWGDVTWWLLTGKNPWRYLSKFIQVPHWTMGRVYYRSIHTYGLGGDEPGVRIAKGKGKKTNRS